MLTTIHSAVSCPHPAARTPLLEKLQHLRGYTSMPPLKVWSWSPDTPVEPGDVGLWPSRLLWPGQSPTPTPTGRDVQQPWTSLPRFGLVG